MARRIGMPAPPAQCVLVHRRFRCGMSRNLGPLRTEGPGWVPQSPLDPLGQSGGALPGGSPGRDGRLATVREAKLPAASSPSGIAKMTRGSDAGLAADSGCYALVIYRRAAPVLVWRPAPECPDLPGPCADPREGPVTGHLPGWPA